jgi:hypothetical protein
MAAVVGMPFASFLLPSVLVLALSFFWRVIMIPGGLQILLSILGFYGLASTYRPRATDNWMWRK